MEWWLALAVVVVMTCMLWYVLRVHARETKALLTAMDAVRLAMLQHGDHLLARIETVEQHMVTFVTQITEDAASVLHQPHAYAKDMDLLIEEFFAKDELPTERLSDLKQRLRRKILDPLEERPKENVRQRQKAASMMLRAIEQQQQAKHPPPKEPS